MSLMKSIAAEIVALFIDDGKMAIVALAWLAIIALVRHFEAPAAWMAPMLVIGLAVILLESVWRRAREGKV
jgi:hypothetical protein